MTRRLLAVLAAACLLCCQAAQALATSAVPGAAYDGVTLSEIQVGPVGNASARMAEAQVLAAREAWSARVVRLQVDQDKLTFASGSCPLTLSGCLVYYREIVRVVRFALHLGLTVVINDTTDTVPFWTRDEPMPTHATEVFWKYMAQAFSGYKRVIFDLFNEPRGLGGTGASQWKVWRDGGTVQGVSGYLGMQTVLSYVRRTLRAPNTVWIDGLDAAGTLNGIARHNAPGTADGAPGSVGASYGLSQAGDPVAGPLVYSFHHPVGEQTRTAWWRDFGYLTTMGYKVTDGEWNNSVDGIQYCWPDAPVTVPAYLGYLTVKRVGLTAWELGPNVNPAANFGPATWAQSVPFNYHSRWLANSAASYERPTTLSGKPAYGWNCNDNNDAGAGQLLMKWFALQRR